MSTKVKGLLKGLRYISQIFDEKEEEIQIGLPTDVKHVAHIGSDDPSANAPSWRHLLYLSSEVNISDDINNHFAEHKENSKGSKIRHLIPKSRHQSIDSEGNPTKHRHTRRHQRTSDPSADSSTHGSSGGSRHRRHRRGSNQGLESPSQDAPPKHSHRRKSKNSEDGSSRRSSKGGDSLTDISLTDFGSGSTQ
ncbi:CRIB domain-containing protein RIC7-like [Gastrolobium bilobum]|uniref:CRIB domain-containing protein RIC7-like n=1 Tax=Gastrolobium bilobum TaxID=150636 RepID=UPI002AB1EF1B|nr:CRIB domain-containing protein RIC7-like [Gastrolobium bilobum]